ncbi:hypothetical protein [Nocardiopsis synnemataformans]|uniref:hypothetical protein n=1 Tax=Nocardiopsis synnemataformans TaxID=61305 RepID=UPI003EB91855
MPAHPNTQSLVLLWVRLVEELQVLLAQLPLPIDLPAPKKPGDIGKAVDVLERTLDLLESEPLASMVDPYLNRNLRRITVWLLDSEVKLGRVLSLEEKGRTVRRFEREALRLALRRAHQYIADTHKRF